MPQLTKQSLIKTEQVFLSSALRKLHSIPLYTSWRYGLVGPDSSVCENFVTIVWNLIMLKMRAFIPVTLLAEYENRSGPRMRARGVVRPTLVCSRRRRNHSGQAFPGCAFCANFR